MTFFKNCVHWSIKIIINNTLSNAQDAGNFRASKFQIF